MKIKTKVASVVAGLGLAATGAVVAQSPAQAHFYNSDSAALCGGGYALVWQDFKDSFVLDVRRSGNSWCAVSRKLVWHGTPSWVVVKIRPHNYTTFYNVDSGNYSHFAGPVYQGGVTCVDVSGGANSPWGTEWITPENIGC